MNTNLAHKLYRTLGYINRMVLNNGYEEQYMEAYAAGCKEAEKDVEKGKSIDQLLEPFMKV